MAKRAIPFVMTAISVLLLLAVGEFGLRLLGYSPRVVAPNEQFWASGWAEIDDALGWRNQEGAFHSTEPGHALMTYGADGRRADLISPKPGALPKIMVVGCSFTQGEGVADDETYSHVLNARLKDFEVINYGTGGYGTYQSLLRMRTYFGAPHLKTPVVIYGLQGHHMARNLAEAGWIFALTTRDGRWLVPPHVRVSGDRLVEYEQHSVELWPFETRFATVALAHIVTLKLLNRFAWREYESALRQLVAQMKDTAARNGASLLVVNLFRTLPEHVEWMRRSGIDYVDCEHPDVLNVKFRVGGIGHPNGLMHRWWGECLAEALRSRGIE